MREEFPMHRRDDLMRQELANAPSGARRLPHDERPMSDIVTELWENTEVLVRRELELAVTEVEQKAHRLKQEVTLSAAGGAVTYAGALAFVASAILLLAKAVDPWIAALIVGAIVTASGYFMLKHGADELAKTDMKPNQTTRSVQRTAHTLKEAVNDATRR